MKTLSFSHLCIMGSHKFQDQVRQKFFSVCLCARVHVRQKTNHTIMLWEKGNSEECKARYELEYNFKHLLIKCVI
jgi:hypothetical protein